MPDFVELHDHPPLSEPVLIVAMEGWIDSGQAAGTAMSSILDSIDTDPIATFDTDAFLDQRARRPIMSIVDGHVRELRWPSIELRYGVDDAGNHVLLLVGAEPDHRWQDFCTAVVDLALNLDVRLLVGLGAYPAPVPHTRPAALSLTSPSEELVESYIGFVKGTVEVPAGIQTAIEVAAHEAGITALGLWAQVPHYISGMAYSAAAMALIEGLGRVAGLSFPTAELALDAAAVRDRLDELVAANPQHLAMLRQLEEASDAAPPADPGPLPSGDEIALELEKFLREQG